MPPVLNDLRRQHLLHQRCPQGVPFLHRHRRIGTVDVYKRQFLHIAYGDSLDFPPQIGLGGARKYQQFASSQQGVLPKVLLYTKV